MAHDGAGIEHVLIPGPKVSGWRQLFQRRPDLLECYQRIALIDDDIDAAPGDLSKCFEYGADLKLSIWQPSLSWDSYFTFGFTLRNPLLKVRYVNYIEMMCPFFTRDALAASIPLFSLGLEVGIDLIWCSLGPEREKKFAIIDDIAVRHTRPVGTTKATNGFADAEYEDHIYRCLELFESRWSSCIAYRAIDIHNRPIETQLRVAMKTLAIGPAVVCSSWRTRMKPVADHIRHQFLRQPTYIPNARDRLNSL